MAAEVYGTYDIDITHPLTNPVIYIGTNEVTTIVKAGVADVALFNSKDFSLMIGTAVFAFEGIGL
jgi:hypothetical protein